MLGERVVGALFFGALSILFGVASVRRRVIDCDTCERHVESVRSNFGVFYCAHVYKYVLCGEFPKGNPVDNYVAIE